LIVGWKEKPKKLQQNAKERIFLKKRGVKWKTKYMRNCNWMTKLKKKTSIKGIRMKLEIKRMRIEIKKKTYEKL